MLALHTHRGSGGRPLLEELVALRQGGLHAVRDVRQLVQRVQDLHEHGRLTGALFLALPPPNRPSRAPDERSKNQDSPIGPTDRPTSPARARASNRRVRLLRLEELQDVREEHPVLQQDALEALAPVRAVLLSRHGSGDTCRFLPVKLELVVLLSCLHAWII